MLAYDEPLFRPPSEARSLILQATLGCSHNRCTFCSMYRQKRFRPRPPGEVLADAARARAVRGPDVERIFLADGDVMCLSPRRLLDLLRPLQRTFPGLQRVGVYANARDVLQKSDAQLRELRRHKLGILYLGLESGDEPTLARVHKGATADQIVTAAIRAREAGMDTSVMVLIGLAGAERSLEHAAASAAAVSAMAPTYTGLLTYTPVPGSPLYAQLKAGAFQLPDPRGSLLEIQAFVQGLRCQTRFSCNHASNYLPLRGDLPADQGRLLALLQAALRGEIALRPEFLRGL